MCSIGRTVDFLGLEAAAGHFLIMDTGLGKTVTSLVYAYRLASTGSKKAVKKPCWKFGCKVLELLLEGRRVVSDLCKHCSVANVCRQH